MAVYRRPARQRFVLVVLTLLSITVITLDQRGQTGDAIDTVRDAARDAFAPVQSAADTVLSPVGDFFGGIVHYGDLQAENRRLREELEAARGRIDRAAEIEQEHAELAAASGLDLVDDIPAVTARVVSTAPSNFELTIQINKGSSAGVARGMPVVTGEGLVGRVIEVSSRRASVLLLTDPNSSVGVRLSRSRDVGVAEGRGQGDPLGVDLIDPATDVARRELVVTSGQENSVFPPGIPVGRVRSSRVDEGELEQEVTLDPVADLERLSFVRVLQWSPP